MLAVRLDPETEERLSRLAHETGRSKSYYVKQAIENYLEECEDYLLALAVLVELTVTAEKQLGETIEEIVAIIKGEFPEARAAVAGWFRSYFRIEGTPEQIVTVLEDTGRTRSMLETTIERWKQQGVEEGLEKGRQEGLQEARLTLAKRLLERGVPPEEIVEVTELSVETVESLADDSDTPT